MEIKRVLTWYLVILVVMAGGVYLGLELFVNDSGPVNREEQGLAETAAEETSTAPGSTPETPSASPAGNPPSDAANSGLSGGSESDAPAAAGIQGGASGTGGDNVESPRAVPPAANTGGNYTVQVAALSSRPKADEMIGKLAGEGFPAARIAPDAGDNLNRVWVGEFPTRAEAASMAEQLKGKGYNTYVRTMP